MAQLLAGMWEFRNRNVFGATGFSTFGALLALEITEIVLAIGFFNISYGGTTWWLHVGGWCGVVTAAVAWYTSAAGVINGMSPTPVLPVGAAPVGRIGSPMPRRSERAEVV